MEETGICRFCKRVSLLRNCNVCNAKVCSNCILPFGCKICNGKIKLKK